MRAAIYNPYLDTLGGGERYTMAFANVLAKNGFKVDISWKDANIRKKLEERFGIELNEIRFIDDVNRGDGYDLCFWVSDGSIPALKARNNYLHFQIPFTNVGGKSLLNRMKLFRFQKIICNSFFTKKIIDKEYGVSSAVIYPPVAIDEIKPQPKENIILSIGRFSQLTQAKRQDVLIDVFKKLYKENVTDWKLVLAGGVEVGGQGFVKKLLRMAKGYPIEILENSKFSEIKKLYGKAKLFWSASGFGVDENKNPKALEHFGITVVEAMGAGAVPLVFNGGGHRESVKNNENGFLWSKKNELYKITLSLIKDPKLIKILAKNSVESSKKFGYVRFEEEVNQILKH